MNISKKWLMAFDWIVVILEITYGISLIMHLFYLMPSLGMLIPFVSFMMFAHIYRFGLNFSVLKIFIKKPLFTLFFLILFFDLIQSLFNGLMTNAGIAAARIVNNSLFVSYLYNLYQKYGFDYVFKPYLGYSLYNVFAIILMTCLIVAGASWQQNQLSNDLPLLANHLENSMHYFPYCLSLVSEFHPFYIFGTLPNLTGLSHEPHIIMMIITPALVISLRYKTKVIVRIMLFVIYLYVLFETTAATAIMCFCIIFIAHLVWMALFSNKKLYVIPIIFFVLLFITINFEKIMLIYSFAGDKLDSSGSMDDTSSLLFYILKPASILGYGNLPPGNDHVFAKGVSAGLLTSVMEIILYIGILLYSIKKTLSKTNYEHFLGLGLLYYILHILKVSYLVYGYPLHTFIIFLVCMSSSKKKLSAAPKSSKLVREW